ncbi:SnoaL-like domain-containing protein [Lishizhenia tianjinensis]|uniref:SnoaL-like domain-containing protein n=1 Tax=Lishizhenia tianjinensis TaxID=477690 RepID=A0A1I6YIF2_9FLAO|nr:nuclear transport factor 2 family protein [Lishizhenia tianjinensis]SFT50309.1 SnoaL-like domain-containing protein [Lishizhenia tianjinensis]
MKKLLLLGVIGLLAYTQKEKNVYPQLDDFMDEWHKAATDANFEKYFGAMHADFNFLGTAPGEKWDKAAFAAFSKPYFDKGKAWDFTASNRQWYGDTTSGIVWFDEDLDTWMEDCRGSGVMQKIEGEWKLSYYNLTVLIENEKIKEFIALRKAE